MAAWAGLQLVSFAAAAAALVILAARLFGGSISVWVGPTGEVLPGAWVRELTVEERSLITWLPSVDPLVVVSVLFGLAACVWGIAHMGRLLVLTQMSRVPTHGSVSTAGVDNLSWSPPLAWLWLAQTVYTAVIGLRYLDEQPSVTDEKWHTAIAIWLIGTAVWLTINFGAALVRRFRRRHPAVQLRAA